MADVITRFKLETTQYNSALRDATKGLKDIVHQTELAGNDFKEFSNRAIEAARALGQQATGATNAKDKVKELVSSYNEMAKTYNMMSDAMKKSEGGKALSASLQQLQQRINDAKAEMNATPGVLDKLADKFTVNVDALKLLNWGLQAAEGALKVAKDAFFASESNVDEWGRTMQAAESVYSGFLTSLNNSDFSGFLTHIDEIVQAARTAYDELDRLGTMKTIQAPQTERQNAENIRLRTILMTGRYIAPAAGSGMKASMATGTLLSPDQLREIETMLQNGMNNIVKLTGNELKQTGKAIDAYYDSLAKQNGMTMDEFRKGTSSMAEFDKRLEGYGKYQQWRQENSFTDAWGNTRYREGNPYQEFKKWGTFRVDKMGENSYNELVNLIRQQQQQTSQMYSTIGQAYRTINRAEGITVKGIMGADGDGKGGKSGSGSTKTAQTELQQNQAEINRLTQEYVRLGDMSTQSAEERKAAIQDEIEKLKERNGLLGKYAAQAEGRLMLTGSDINLKGLGSFSETMNPFAADNRQIQTHGALKVTLDDKFIEGFNRTMADAMSKKNDRDVLTDSKKLVSGLSQVAGGLEQMGIKLPAEVQQVIAVINGVMTVIEGANTILSVFGNSIMAANTVAITANTAALWAVAATNLIPGLAGGGIIKAASGTIVGNSYSGDNLRGIGPGGQLYGLNAGEVVLNRAESGIIASALDGAGGGFKNGTIVGVLEGEKIKLVLNRHYRRIGEGEIVTWKNG